MRLYEISSAIEQINSEFDARVELGEFTDPETGVEMDPERMLDRMVHAIDELEIEGDQKALDIACLVKSLNAEAKAFEDEEKRLMARRCTILNKVKWLKGYLAENIEEGRKIECPKARIGWRKSERVNIKVSPDLLPDAYRCVEYKPLKAIIKRDLKGGDPLAFAELETVNNIQIS